MREGRVIMQNAVLLNELDIQLSHMSFIRFFISAYIVIFCNCYFDILITTSP